MRTSPKILIPLMLALVSCLPVLIAPPDAAGRPDTDALVENNTAFALDLYAHLAAGEGNLFLSPYGISESLAMAFAGARGRTEKEMAGVLRFDIPGNRLHGTFSDLRSRLDAHRKKGSIDLAVANALWAQRGFRFLPEFLGIMDRHYGAGLHEVDFAGATETARQTINRWVEKQTGEKIRELFRPGVLSASTTLVISNAVHFKGNWAWRFDRGLTGSDRFHVTPAQTVTVDMMHRTSNYRFAAFDAFKALELPYLGEGVSMVILLPDRIDGLKRLEGSLTTANLSGWLKRTRSARPSRVELALPRFRLASEFRLRERLSEMGMPSAFGNADFSGMTGGRDLFISSMVHKAVIDVNEEGTEASAATGIAMDSIERFRVDHPFLFLIVDNSSGTVLFLGRVVNPALS